MTRPGQQVWGKWRMISHNPPLRLLESTERTLWSMGWCCILTSMRLRLRSLERIVIGMRCNTLLIFYCVIGQHWNGCIFPWGSWMRLSIISPRNPNFWMLIRRHFMGGPQNYPKHLLHSSKWKHDSRQSIRCLCRSSQKTRSTSGPCVIMCWTHAIPMLFIISFCPVGTQNPELSFEIHGIPLIVIEVRLEEGVGGDAFMQLCWLPTHSPEISSLYSYLLITMSGVVLISLFPCKVQTSRYVVVGQMNILALFQ